MRQCTVKPAWIGHFRNSGISGISEKQRIKLDIFVNFLKKKHFFTLQNNSFFDFNLQFWRSATLLIRTLYLLFQVAFRNQLTIVFAPLKVISTFKTYCTPYELLVSVLWLTLSFGEVSKDLPENALKFRGHVPL